MLVDALRPPEGHTLDCAVGTSFTLDLDALLLATLSFAVFDKLDNDDGTPDPIALLESVRRHADHLTVFAQAGALSGPRNHPPVLAYLEDAVVPVRPAKPGHLFHPKVWALKYVNAAGEASYRLLVLSRNLTFDSSWDTIVRLDSKPGKAPRKQHGALSNFLETLPGLAVNPLPGHRAKQVADLAAELRTVGWENPDGARSIWFHPLGPGFISPKIEGDRVMVMSPFLSPNAASKLGSGPGADLCISRPLALDRVGGRALAGYAETFVVDTADELPRVGHDSSEADGGEGDTQRADELDIDPPRPKAELSGLHAKVYVTETPDYTHLWLGSANATDPAFGGNVEFMVEVNVASADLTIDKILDDGTPNLRSMLTPYTPERLDPAEPTELETAIRDLDRLVRDLATGQFAVHVEDGDLSGTWTLHLTWPTLIESQNNLMTKHGIDLTIGPATQGTFRLPWIERNAVVTSASLEAITSFLTVEARTRVDGEAVVSRTLVNATLTGGPADRKEQLLASLLDDPAKVLRYLLFLLSELTGDSTLLDALGGSSSAFSWTSAEDAPPILESLLRALANSPGSLDRVAEFVADLQNGPAGELLPPGFDDVWAPINDVRERLS